MNVFHLKLDLDKESKGYGSHVVRIRKGDKAGTTIVATLYDHGELVTTSGLTVDFVMLQPDREHYYRATADWDNTTGNATVTLDETYAGSVSGDTDLAYFELRQGTTVIASTESFRVSVLRNAAAEGEEPAESYDDIIPATVYAWLEDHPEATTTVQNDSLTTAKYKNESVTDAKLVRSGGVIEATDGFTDRVNLFDGDSSHIIKCAINGTNGNIGSNNNCRTVIMKAKPNTTYRISKNSGGRFTVGCTTTGPTAGTVCTKCVSDYTSHTIVFTTDSTARFLAAFVYYSTTDGDDVDGMLSSVRIYEQAAADMVVRGDHAALYEKDDARLLEMCEGNLVWPLTRTNVPVRAADANQGDGVKLWYKVPFTMESGKNYSFYFRHSFTPDTSTGVNSNIFVIKPAASDGDESQAAGLRIQKTNYSDFSVHGKWYKFIMSPSADCDYIYVSYYGAMSAAGYADVGMVSEITEEMGYSRSYEYDGGRVSLRRRHTLDCSLAATLTKPSGITTGFQGMAVHEDTLVQLFDQGYFGIYNATNLGTSIGSGQLGSKGSTQHANSATFGPFYDSGDALPLLYVTGGQAGSTGRGYCSVERITQSGGTYSSTLVQTITIDQSGFEAAGYQPVFPYPNFFVWDNMFVSLGAIWRTNGSQRAHDNENRYVIHMFPLPDTSQATVDLTAADVAREIILPYDVEVMQGGTVANGLLLHSFGFGGAQGNAIRAYDLIAGEELARIDAVAMGLPFASVEPESLAVHNGSLLLVNASGKVYRMDF